MSNQEIKELNLEQTLEFIETTLREASKFLTQPKTVYFSFKFSISSVPDLGRAVFTSADIVVQDFIQARLLDAGYSNFGMTAEEDTSLTSCFAQYPQQYRWVLDPIDGTLNFLSGDAGFQRFVHNKFGKEQFERYYHLDRENSSLILGLQMGILNHYQFLVSGVYFPFTDVFYGAIKDRGSYKNGISFSQQKNGNSGLIKTNSLLFRKLQGKSDQVIKAEGAGCTLVRLAEKEDFVFVVENQGIYDVGPLSLIVEEAGGLVCDNYGDRPDFGDRNVPLFFAGSSKEHILKAVKSLENLGYYFIPQIKEGWSA